MRKILLIILVVLIIGVGGFYLLQSLDTYQKLNYQGQVDKALIGTVVEDFSKSIKNVSLGSPTVSDEIEDNYSSFLTPQLLDTWKIDPSKALGRITSSPWPDRIEIEEITKISDSQYLVKGKIIEITSVEEVQGGIANERNVEISVIKLNDKWLIDNATAGSYTNNQNWQNSTIQTAQGKISFGYPQNLPTTYILAQEWPPKIEITDNQLNCPEISVQNGLFETISSKKINNRAYCVIATNEGAAGSVYTTYSYLTSLDNRLLTLNFVLKYPNCDNYDDPQKMQCQEERQSFDLDNLIDQIVQTIKF